MINLAAVDPANLPFAPMGVPSLLPKASSVYFAMDGDEAVHYVGQSKNPRCRWYNHQKYEDCLKVGCIKIAYFLTDELLLDSVEKEFIKRFRPALNGSPGKYYPSTARVSIAEYWPCDEKGVPCTVNSIRERFLKTQFRVSQATLRQALDGTLERGKFDTLCKLAAIASAISGRVVTINDLIKVNVSVSDLIRVED